MAFPHSPPIRHSTRMCPSRSSPRQSSLPPALTARAWEDSGIQSISPTSRRAPQGCAPELRMPQLRRPELQRQLSRGDGITSVFHGHKATPRPAAPHPLVALAAASPHSYYRPPRPGLSVSHHARRPLVPGAHAWRKLSPYAAATMVVSDELPKAPSKERGKSEFFFRKSELVTRN